MVEEQKAFGFFIGKEDIAPVILKPDLSAFSWKYLLKPSWIPMKNLNRSYIIEAKNLFYKWKLLDKKVYMIMQSLNTNITCLSHNNLNGENIMMKGSRDVALENENQAQIQTLKNRLSGERRKTIDSDDEDMRQKKSLDDSKHYKLVKDNYFSYFPSGSGSNQDRGN